MNEWSRTGSKFFLCLQWFQNTSSNSLTPLPSHVEPNALPLNVANTAIGSCWQVPGGRVKALPRLVLSGSSSKGAAPPCPDATHAQPEERLRQQPVPAFHLSEKSSLGWNPQTQQSLAAASSLGDTVTEPHERQSCDRTAEPLLNPRSTKTAMITFTDISSHWTLSSFALQPRLARTRPTRSHLTRPAQHTSQHVPYAASFLFRKGMCVLQLLSNNFLVIQLSSNII